MVIRCTLKPQLARLMEFYCITWPASSFWNFRKKLTPPPQIFIILLTSFFGIEIRGCYFKQSFYFASKNAAEAGQMVWYIVSFYYISSKYDALHQIWRFRRSWWFNCNELTSFLNFCELWAEDFRLNNKTILLKCFYITGFSNFNLAFLVNKIFNILSKYQS